MGRLKQIVKNMVDNPKTRMKIYNTLQEDIEFREYIRRGDWKSAYFRGLRILESLNVPLKPEHYTTL
jgi:hypothetical protein